MPLYDYLCEQCGRHTEKIQKFSDPILTVCPHCAGPMERVMHAPAVAFKGGGWYADGYGNATPAAAKSEGGSTGKSDSAAPVAPSSAPGASSGSESASAPAAAPSAPTPAASAPASSSSDKK